MKILISSHGCGWAANNMALHLASLGATVGGAGPADLRLLIGFYRALGLPEQKNELTTAKKKVVWWVGTDILWMEQARDPAEIAWLNQNVHEHWAEWDLSKARLENLGLQNVRVVPMPTRSRYHPLPLPREFAVGCYSYDSRAGFYGRDIITAAARLTPEIKWIIYPSTPRFEGNIEYVCRIEPDRMEDLYRMMSVHARIVSADGMPQGPMEAAMCGRQVIYNVAQLPHCIWMSPATPELLAARVRQIKSHMDQGEWYNAEGAAYWREFNDPARFVSEIKRVLS